MRSRFAARACRLTAVADSRCRGRSRRLEYASSFEAGDRLAGWSRADSGFGPDSVTNTVYLYAASGCTTNVLERYADGTERNVSYTWTDDYRLASVSVDGAAVAEYAYDVLGNLVAVATADESFEILVDNGHSLADVSADGTPLRVYMRGPGVDNWLGFVDMTGATPVPYFYVTDHLGSVLAVVDANGNVVERYEYDAWGKVFSVVDGNGQTLSRSAIGNRILWQGREYSWSTGLYYFRNRWYDPVIGRWISKDPIGISGGINLYEFCGDHPVNSSDPLGWCAERQMEFYFLGLIKPLIIHGEKWYPGKHFYYRPDIYGHGQRSDGSPIQFHVDLIPQRGSGKVRFHLDGTPLEGEKGSVPKSDDAPSKAAAKDVVKFMKRLGQGAARISSSIISVPILLCPPTFIYPTTTEDGREML